MTPKELNELNSEAEIVICLQEFSKRLIRHGNYFDEAHERDRMNDCYLAAKIIESAIPFVTQGMEDVADGKIESDAAKLYRVVSEDGKG